MSFLGFLRAERVLACEPSWYASEYAKFIARAVRPALLLFTNNPGVNRKMRKTDIGYISLSIMGLAYVGLGVTLDVNLLISGVLGTLFAFAGIFLYFDDSSYDGLKYWMLGLDMLTFATSLPSIYKNWGSMGELPFFYSVTYLVSSALVLLILDFSDVGKLKSYLG